MTHRHCRPDPSEGARRGGSGITLVVHRRKMAATYSSSPYLCFFLIQFRLLEEAETDAELPLVPAHAAVLDRAADLPHFDWFEVAEGLADGAAVRRVFHQLRAVSREHCNGQCKGSFDVQGAVPTTGLSTTRRFALGAVVVYHLTRWYRHEQGLDLRVGLAPFLKAA